MPEIRVRTNGVGGVIDDATAITGGVGLTAAATTLTSAALAAAPVVSTGQHWPIVLDPDGEFGVPEIAWVTAHTAGATTATIARGQETWAGGIAARAHFQDVNWVHAMTVLDYPGTPGGMGIIGQTVYTLATDTSYAITTTASADVDATNLKVDFIVPPTGRVRVFANVASYVGTTVDTFLGLREGATVIKEYLAGSAYRRASSEFVVTGLTPGQAKTYKLSARTQSGTFSIFSGPTYGPIIMTVEAVNY